MLNQMIAYIIKRYPNANIETNFYEEEATFASVDFYTGDDANHHLECYYSKLFEKYTISRY